MQNPPTATDLYDFLTSTISDLQKIEEARINQEKHKEELRKEKKIKATKGSRPKQNGFEDSTSKHNAFPDYRPPGWKDIGMSYSEISQYFNSIRYKKSEQLSEHELDLVKNVRLLKDSYCTNDPELELAEYFIGKFNLDPFHNPYAKTTQLKYAEEGIQLLDGLTPEKDGFVLENWPTTAKSIFVNPPFSRLPFVSKLCNEASKRENKPSIALIANLDYNNYVKEAYDYADICIMLGRVNYKAMVGVSVSTPKWNNIMLIYNTKKTLPNGSMKIKVRNKDFYAIDLRNKSVLNISQMDLFNQTQTEPQHESPQNS